MTIPRNTPVAITRVPTIQYSSGHTRGRHSASTPFGPFVGFHSEIGRDAGFDDACRQALVARIEIRHGSGTITPHWFFGERLALFPLTAGPVATTMAGSLANGNARRTADAGIGARWAGGEKSRCAVRGYLAPLVASGWVELVQVAVSSRMTDALITALCDHTRVCTVADSLVDRARHPEPIGLVELVLPLGIGAEVPSGNGKDQVLLSPLVSVHPAQVDKPVVIASWRGAAVAQAAERDWPTVVAWAHDYAQGGGDVGTEE